MAQFSGFFNSTLEDVREYQASDFAAYFRKFLSDGVYVENNKMGLEVRVNPDGKIAVGPGAAYIKGYIYTNSEDIILTAPVADSVLSRRSRVFLTLDEAKREIKVEMKQGSLASDPVAPEPIRTSNTIQLSLANVFTERQSTRSVVTDERLTDLCGRVSLLVETKKGNTEDLIANLSNTKLDKSFITVSNQEPDVNLMEEGSIWFTYE